MRLKRPMVNIICQVLLYLEGVWASWEEWWTYDGISGPAFWGLLNPEWRLCTKGRRQSPVNLTPDHLLYDPNLKHIQVDKLRVAGTITNTGHSIIFRADKLPAPETINITGGPLSYRYRFSEIHIHYGSGDDRGSEHTVGGYGFPAELQILGYNSDLYNNMSEAMRKNHGLTGISVMMQMGDLSNSDLRILTSQLHRINYRGQSARLKHVSVTELLPNTPFYMTYDGSVTYPGCYETVTWMVMNRPIYITKQQLFVLRKLMQGDSTNQKAPIENNFRPTQPINNRVIRTNIDFTRQEGKGCPTMENNPSYQGQYSCQTAVFCSWEEWWTYDGISGPDFWGLLNPEWSLCSKGRRQSPVDIKPEYLLYDPKLEAFHVNKEKVGGMIENTGHSVVFRVSQQNGPPANVSGGPLSYRYQFHEIHLHYGRSDERGSEHTIAGFAFPAEIQIYGFNNQLYESMEESLEKTQGLVGIALLLQLGEVPNPQLEILTSSLEKITYKGMQSEVNLISIRDLLPDTSHYITYEGSTTMPGCYETVTWIIVNKPLYITKQQLYSLRKLMQGEPTNPKTSLADNFRPPLHLHHRPVRTNIALTRNPPCPTTERSVFYKANIHRHRP